MPMTFLLKIIKTALNINMTAHFKCEYMIKKTITNL